MSFSRSLTKTLNNMGPNINLQGTLLATGCQAGTSRWLLPFGNDKEPLDVLNVDNTSHRAGSSTVIGGHLRWLLAAGFGSSCDFSSCSAETNQNSATELG